MPHVAFFLNSTPARSAAAQDPDLAPGLEGLDAGAKVFGREHSTVDFDGERYVYADEHFQVPLGYVDAALLSTTPPPPAPPAKVEVVEEEVVTTTTKKTVVLRLTEEEARYLLGLIGPETGRLARTIFSPLHDALS